MREGLCILILTVLLLFCNFEEGWRMTTNRSINILLFGYWLSIPYPHQIITNTMTSLVIHSVDNTCCIVPLDVLLKSKMRRELWWHQVLPAYTVLPHYRWRTKWMVTYNMYTIILVSHGGKTRLLLPCRVCRMEITSPSPTSAPPSRGSIPNYYK